MILIRQEAELPKTLSSIQRLTVRVTDNRNPETTAIGLSKMTGSILFGDILNDNRFAHIDNSVFLKVLNGDVIARTRSSRLVAKKMIRSAPKTIYRSTEVNGFKKLPPRAICSHNSDLLSRYESEETLLIFLASVSQPSVEGRHRS